jgi:hypothetical protein
MQSPFLDEGIIFPLSVKNFARFPVSQAKKALFWSDKFFPWFPCFSLHNSFLALNSKL